MWVACQAPEDSPLPGLKHVACRFITDSKLFNEWMNNGDYELSDDDMGKSWEKFVVFKANLSSTPVKAEAAAVPPPAPAPVAAPSPAPAPAPAPTPSPGLKREAPGSAPSPKRQKVPTLTPPVSVQLRMYSVEMGAKLSKLYIPIASARKLVNSARSLGVSLGATFPTGVPSTAKPPKEVDVKAKAKFDAAMKAEMGEFTRVKETLGLPPPEGVAEYKTTLGSLKVTKEDIVGLRKIPRPPPPASTKLAYPSCSAWFHKDRIHPLERRHLPEFFAGDCSSKTPTVYQRWRNFMIDLYASEPTTYLTYTTCRRSL